MSPHQFPPSLPDAGVVTIPMGAALKRDIQRLAREHHVDVGECVGRLLTIGYEVAGDDLAVVAYLSAAPYESLTATGVSASIVEATDPHHAAWVQLGFMCVESGRASLRSAPDDATTSKTRFKIMRDDL